jgi:hypothetical protein
VRHADNLFSSIFFAAAIHHCTTVDAEASGTQKFEDAGEIYKKAANAFKGMLGVGATLSWKGYGCSLSLSLSIHVGGIL